MASSPQPPMDKARTLPFPSNMYLSPPEETPLDSFSTEVSPSPAHKKWETTLPPIQTGPSPPVSPEAPPLPRITALNEDSSQHSHTQDPLLYPGSQNDSNAAPLFDNDSQPIASRQDSFSPVKKQAVQPRPAIYADRLEPGFKRIHPQFKSFKTGDEVWTYYKDQMEELSGIPGWGTRREPAEPPVSTLPETYTAAQKRRLQKTYAGVQKRTAAAPRLTKAAANTTGPTTEAPTPKPAKAAIPAVTPRKTTTRAPSVPRDHKSASVEPQSRKRAQPTKGGPPKAEDKNWAQLPDYSPPTTTLDNKPTKTLKVAWKGVPNDLSVDPDIAHMHPHEVEAAAELKLPAAQYLANKRRIFAAKLASLRDGRTFTKTAAQQACNIDVNKTSQLFVAFERSGWFDQKHFAKWLL